MRHTIRDTRIAVVVLVILYAAVFASEIIRLPRESVYPGVAPGYVSEVVLEARDLVINRRYGAAEKLLWKVTREHPDDPVGPAALMVVYEVRMLENEEPYLNKEMDRVVKLAQKALHSYKRSAEKNAWYYTIIGAALGIEGIFHLWKDDYFPAAMRGYNSIQYMRKAVEKDPENWEARLGLGVYTYYRNAYAAKVPFLPDRPERRDSGIAEVELAGRNRAYLDETSRIALCRIFLDAGEYDRARYIADGLVEDYPTFMVFHLFAARAMFSAERYGEALLYYEKAYSIDPGLPFSAYRAGACLEKMGDEEAARGWFKKAARAYKVSGKWSKLASGKLGE